MKAGEFERILTELWQWAERKEAITIFPFRFGGQSLCMWTHGYWAALRSRRKLPEAPEILAMHILLAKEALPKRNRYILEAEFWLKKFNAQVMEFVLDGDLILDEPIKTLKTFLALYLDELASEINDVCRWLESFEVKLDDDFTLEKIRGGSVSIDYEGMKISRVPDQKVNLIASKLEALEAKIKSIKQRFQVANEVNLVY